VSPIAKKIVFVQRGAIWVMNVDGSGRHDARDQGRPRRILYADPPESHRDNMPTLLSQRPPVAKRQPSSGIRLRSPHALDWQGFIGG
jgi:hypothetical protein